MPAHEWPLILARSSFFQTRVRENNKATLVAEVAVAAAGDSAFERPRGSFYTRPLSRGNRRGIGLDSENNGTEEGRRSYAVTTTAIQCGQGE